MAVPTLTPSSQTSAVRLPVTGTLSKASASGSYPFGVYTKASSAMYSTNFVSGAVEQVAYTYKKLGGDVLDVELTEENVYASYEEAVLEYSYLLNVHQGKNVLHNVLGDSTGSFDHHGNILAGTLSSSLSGTHVNLKYPRFDFSYSKRIGQTVSTEVDLGGNVPIYSASFDTVNGQQDYDLAQIVQSSSVNDSTTSYYNQVGDNKITIRKVFYKTPHAMWRFYGYYGGLNTVGNLSTYGMYADDSTFEVIPVWQNKSQAMAYEDAIWTRNSHYSYEIKDNNLRIFPEIVSSSPRKVWFEFTVDNDAWTQVSGSTGVDREIEGVNNLGTMPFGNVPYENINAIGKQWIRRFAIALSKEMLGQIRGKFATIPIPGESVNLNAGELLSQAKEEQNALREELKAVLDELTYAKLAQQEADMMQSSKDAMEKVPTGIFVG
jgi:hypothetical protein